MTMCVQVESEVVTAIEQFSVPGTAQRDAGPAGRPAASLSRERVPQEQVDAAAAHLKDKLSAAAGFHAGLLLVGQRGELVLYSQWTREETAPIAMPEEWSLAPAVPGLDRVDARTYIVDFTAPLAVSEASLPETPHAHFGVFTVEPENQEAMLELARRHAPDSIGTPGLRAVNFHRSLDGRRVINLGLWGGFGEFEKLLDRPGFTQGGEYWTGVATFQPHFFDVVAVVDAKPSELAVWATIKVLPGQQENAEKFFAFSREVLDAEPGTTSFFAVKMDEETYGIFDTFTDEASLSDHIAGASGKQAVADLVGTVFAGPPKVANCVVVQRA